MVFLHHMFILDSCSLPSTVYTTHVKAAVSARCSDNNERLHLRVIESGPQRNVLV